MSTVKITYSGPTALAVAQPDYTIEDWDEAAYELGRRDYTLIDDQDGTDHYVAADGSEVFVWVREPSVRDLRDVPSVAAQLKLAAR